MEVITKTFSMKGRKPCRSVRVGGTQGERYALFCVDNKVVLTDYKDYSKVYMVCDAELFLKMVGLHFVIRRAPGKTIKRKDLII